MMARALEEAGYIRFGAAPAGPQREWLHFLVRDRACELLVNFSLLRGPVPGAAVVGNVLLLARFFDEGGARWEGDLDAHEVRAGDLGTGRVRLRLGDCSLEFDEGFRVRARCRRRALSVELTLTPESHAYLVPNVALEGGAAVSWLVAPRLRAAGVVRWEGRVIRIEDAVAYHDHNWGRFTGSELQWEWGCSLAAGSAEDEPLSVVTVRVLDRARARVAAQGVLVWEGAHRRRMFRGREAEMASVGWLRAAGGPRVPRALSLLAPGPPTGVPARVRLRAAAGGDHLEGAFLAEDVARVLAPRDTDLGTTIIHEVVGRMSLEGSLGGRGVSLDAPAFFEVLGDAP